MKDKDFILIIIKVLIPGGQEKSYMHINHYPLSTGKCRNAMLMYLNRHFISIPPTS